MIVRRALVGLAVAQPSSVCGYGDHAPDQMRERGFTPFDVRMAVASAPTRRSSTTWATGSTSRTA